MIERIPTGSKRHPFAAPQPEPKPMPSRRRWPKIVGAVFLTCVVAATAFAIPRLGDEPPPPASDRQSARHDTVAIFGATGRVGEGILTAALHDADVGRVHVVTRRSSPAIERGAALGVVRATTHMDYLDYAAIRPILAEVDHVYWALGTSTLNVDSAEYAQIHLDFPKALIREWTAVRGAEAVLTFHYISGSGASADAWTRWAREKARAERELAALVRGTNVRVVSYRPGGVVAVAGDVLTPRQRLSRALFVPTKLSIDAASIGEAMLEVTARGDGTNGRILENRELLSLAIGYRGAARPRAGG
jgi:nucleoside-diphosphate-sugar epimerase